MPGDKKKGYLQQLETFAKAAKTAPTPPSSHSDQSSRYPHQQNDQGATGEPGFNNDTCAPESLLGLGPDSCHPIDYQEGSELDIPGFLPGLSPFNLVTNESIDELQNAGNTWNETLTITPILEPTLGLHSNNESIETEFSNCSKDNQQMLTHNFDQSHSSSSKLKSMLRFKDGVSQKYTLEDILVAGIRTLSAEEQQRNNDAESNDSSPNTLEYDPRKTHLEQFEIPDIHMNTIRLATMSFVAACFANAGMLGISPEVLWDPASQSPFYQTQMANEPFSMANAGHFSHLKPLLQPSATQLTHPHHPYLDILPFPAVRNRIIQLLQLKPPPFDPDQLCHDLRNDGIICWGSTRRNRQGPVCSGAPWDIRSWEIKPWFLKKWWILFDGPDGEMYPHSRWWCELRGEKSSYPWS